MKIISTLIYFAATLPFACAYAQSDEAPQVTGSNKPIVAVPKFENRTQEGSGIALPSSAEKIAADEVSKALISSRKFSVLSRSKFSIVKRNDEELYAGDASFSVLKDLKAKYLVLGSLSGFRIDKTSGTAYGVQVERITARVTMDVRAVDVDTGEITYQASPTKGISFRMVDNTKSTLPSDWETLLRKAVRDAADDMIGELLRGSGAVASDVEEIMVSISSKPEGADIMLNGDFVGNTPADVPVAKGRCTIKIELQGFQPWERQVRAFEGLSVSAVLKEIPVPTAEPQESVQ